MKSTLVYLSVCLVLGETAVAQSEEPHVEAALRRSSGLTRHEGRLLGVGPGYKAEFDPGRMVLTPALGPSAPRTQSFAFELESIRRGDERIVTGGPVEPVQVGRVAKYRRDLGIVERYEVRADGVHQSFLFPQRPGRAGALVVRGRITTELPLASANEREGLHFELDGVGGVTVGAVTGVDAAGRRAAGELRLDGELLELVLPGDFVERATYPLVLDPIIGPVLTLSPPISGQKLHPDMDYDPGCDEFFVVWSQRNSVGDHDLWGRRFAADGTAVGTSLLIDSGNGKTHQPSVAYVKIADAFVIAWRSSPMAVGSFDTIRVATLLPSGSISGSVLVGSGTDPDVGGERETGVTYDAAIVAYDTGSGIGGARVEANSFTDPVVASTFSISTSSYDGNPAISKSGGSIGRYLVVFESYDVWMMEDSIQGAMVDRDGTLLVSPTTLLMSPWSNQENPDVDGDGTDFLLAYERYGTLSGGLCDIYCVDVAYDGVSLNLGTTTAVSDVVDMESIEPSVIDAGFKHYVSYSSQLTAGGEYYVFTRGVRSSDCSSCGALLYSGTAAGDHLASTMAYKDWGSSSTLLVGWRRDDAGDDYIEGRIIDVGGEITDIGGGCGSAGTPSAPDAAALGQSDYSFELSGASGTFAIHLLNLSGMTTSLCTGCDVLLPKFTDIAPVVAGEASVTVQIPCDSSFYGTVARSQWVMAGDATSPCPGISTSDILEVTLGP